MNQQKTGQFIRALRTEQKLTQEQLAEVLGVSGRSVSRWENGVNMPDLDLLILLAKHFDVEIGELIEGERKAEDMDRKTEEALMQAADYSNEEKSCFTKRIRMVCMAGVLGMVVFCVLDILNLTDVQPYAAITDLALGVVSGALLSGVMYSSNHISKLRAAKMRLFRHRAKQAQE